MPRLLAWLKAFYSPVAIGFYLTMSLVYFTYQFYEDRAHGFERESFFVKMARVAHQKSIDFRLQARGPRPGSDQVALLAVDERSLSTVGRWPWPREKMAMALEKAVEYGAKIIAFDMVFSEPSTEPVREIYEQLKSSGELTPSLDERFQVEIAKHNSDAIFSETIKKLADHFVLGSFFENSDPVMTRSSYPNACANFIFQQSEAYQLWNKEEILLSVTDAFDLYVPDVLADLYKEHLKTIDENARSQFPKPRNRNEEIEIEARVINDKLTYCSQWLHPEKDELYSAISEAWANVKSADSDITDATFEDWAERFKNQYLINSVLVAGGWTMNTPLISSGAKHTGYFNAQLDGDGSIRRSRLVVRTGNHYMPSISLKAFLIAHNYNAEISLGPDPKNPGSKNIQSMKITSNETGEEVFSIPVDGEGNLTINYAGPRKMFPHLSLGDLLNDDDEILVEQAVYNPEAKAYVPTSRKEKKADILKDKILVLGATAIGIFDLRVTPFDENFPGAETHVNVIDNLLRQDFLRTHPMEEVYMFLTILGLGVGLSIALTFMGAVPGMLLTASALAIIILVDRYFLFASGIVVAIVFPLLLVVLLYIGLTFYKYFTEERNKRELRSTFQKYVSPAIVDEILKDPSNIELGGRKERITVFFSDVRGFTTISEKLDPRALSDLLNSYLTPMTDLVFKNRGTLDKYMGDAIMAFFGAPIHYKDHAKFACRCALEHLAKLKELQKEYQAKGLPSIDIGIGLNTGECSVGNMGSQTVRNYTVMGDAVNLASRLEGINKQYGTRVIISEFTYEDVKDSFVCREIDWVRVKGKALPVKIYELVAEAKASPQQTEVLNYFAEGYQLYHAQQFEKAIEQFNRALAINSEDFPSQLYIERCQNFIMAPPPQDWDGVFVMTTK